MKYYVYILQAADGYLYTGTTKNLEKRLECHNRGHGARYTRGRRPVTLLYCEECDRLQSALARERYLRKLPRKKKNKLIKNPQRKSL